MNYIVDLKEFGFEILKARRLRGMSQEEVALKAGINKATVGAIELGKTRPNPKTETGLQKLFPEVFE